MYLAGDESERWGSTINAHSPLYDGSRRFHDSRPEPCDET